MSFHRQRLLIGCIVLVGGWLATLVTVRKGSFFSKEAFVMSEARLEDVVIIDSRNPDFDALAEASAPDWAPFLKKTKPYTLIVENHSTRNIVGFSIKHTLRVEGQLYKELAQFENPDAVSKVPAKSESGFIGAGQRRVVGQGFNIGRYSAAAEASLLAYVKAKDARLSRAEFVSIEFDAVVFDDGYLWGQDTEDLAGKLVALVNERRAIYGTLLAGIDKNLTGMELLPFMNEHLPRTGAPGRWTKLARDSSISEGEYLSYTYDRVKLRPILEAAANEPPFIIYRKKP